MLQGSDLRKLRQAPPKVPAAKLATRMGIVRQTLHSWEKWSADDLGAERARTYLDRLNELRSTPAFARDDWPAAYLAALARLAKEQG